MSASLIGISELGIDRIPAREQQAGRLLRLLLDVPAAIEDLLRCLPDASASCPVAVLVQQIADGGTPARLRLRRERRVRLRDGSSPAAVAHDFDAEVLSLLRCIAARDGCEGGG
ncbi:hypothetical protein [Streptomyces diastatochromogenes]|uniref:hypothetical protein n=1 Tax=Streptomyces diastatochromogenes TaxID=42236 RepID=UPI00367D6C09